MKAVVLSADGDGQVYLVPDHVADNLSAYCEEFRYEWLWTSPDAEKYRKNGVICYNEADFIEYLNQWIFPDEPSVFVESLCNDNDERYEQYRDCPHYHF